MSKFVLTAQLKLQAPTNTNQILNKIRNDFKGIKVPVQIDGATKAQSDIKKVGNEFQKADKKADRFFKTIVSGGKRFIVFAAAGRALSLFTNTLTGAVREAIDFERELIKISQVTGKTLRDLQSLNKTITNLATSLGVSSAKILGVGRILSQAGFRAKDLDVALSALAKTELAPTFENIEQTAEGVVAIFNQFKTSANQLEKQLGAINAVAGQFAVEAGDIISAIRRVGGVFKSAGGDLNELIGLFTSVRATTRESAESIATGLRTIFTRIQRPKTIEFLRQFNVELEKGGRFVGPWKAVEQLAAALERLPEGSIEFVRIAEELGGFRQIGKVIPLLQQFSVAERARQAAVAGGTSLDKDAATAQQALAVQIEKTRERFQALIRDVVQSRTFQILAKGALLLANSIAKVGESLKGILPILTIMGGIKLAGLAGGALKGLGGFLGRGAQSRNTGGAIQGFNRGGWVPGTGNRDTVPAMLQPGEFVIRKKSAQQIGGARLNALNSGQKLNRGGDVKSSKITSLRSAEIQNLIYRKKQRVAKKEGEDFQTSGDEINQFTTADEISANVITRPIEPNENSRHYNKTKFAQGPIQQGEAFEEYLVKTGTIKNKGNFGDREALDGLTKDGTPAEVKRTKVNPAALLDKLLRYQLKFGNKLKQNVLTGRKKGDQVYLGDLVQYTMKKFFGGPVQYLNKGGAVLSNEKEIGGAMLESGLQKSSISVSANDVRDKVGFKNVTASKSPVHRYMETKKFALTRQGLNADTEKMFRNKLLDGFAVGVDTAARSLSSDLELPYVPMDESSKSSFLKQVRPALIGDIFEGALSAMNNGGVFTGDEDPNRPFDFNSGLSAGLRDNYDKLGMSFVDAKSSFAAGSPANFKTKAVNQIASEMVAAGIKDQPIGSKKYLEEKGVSPSGLPGFPVRKNYAKGGPAGSDTVPAMLTPGEFVINKDAAKQIGYGNLHRMNKRGVQGFSEGGGVNVRKFFIGGKTPDELSGISKKVEEQKEKRRQKRAEKERKKGQKQLAQREATEDGTFSQTLTGKMQSKAKEDIKGQGSNAENRVAKQVADGSKVMGKAMDGASEGVRNIITGAESVEEGLLYLATNLRVTGDSVGNLDFAAIRPEVEAIRQAATDTKNAAIQERDAANASAQTYEDVADASRARLEALTNIKFEKAAEGRSEVERLEESKKDTESGRNLKVTESKQLEVEKAIERQEKQSKNMARVGLKSGKGKEMTEEQIRARIKAITQTKPKNKRGREKRSRELKKLNIGLAEAQRAKEGDKELERLKKERERLAQVHADQTKAQEKEIKAIDDQKKQKEKAIKEEQAALDKKIQSEAFIEQENRELAAAKKSEANEAQKRATKAGEEEQEAQIALGQKKASGATRERFTQRAGVDPNKEAAKRRRFKKSEKGAESSDQAAVKLIATVTAVNTGLTAFSNVLRKSGNALLETFADITDIGAQAATQLITLGTVATVAASKLGYGVTAGGLLGFGGGEQTARLSQAFGDRARGAGLAARKKGRTMKKAGGLQGVFGNALEAFGTSLTDNSQRIGQFGAKATQVAGKFALAGIAAFALFKVMDAVIGTEKRRQKAIKAGNVESAKSLSVQSTAQQSLNMVGVAAVGAAFAFNPLAGAAALVVVGFLKLMAQNEAFAASLNSIRDAVLVPLGFQSSKVITAIAGEQAARNKAAREEAENANIRKQAMEEVVAGEKTLAEVFKTGTLTKQLNNQLGAEIEALNVNKAKRSDINKQGDGTGRLMGIGAGALAGGVLGATIGSFVPVIGTAIGGALGAGIGGIVGAAMSYKSPAQTAEERKANREEEKKIRADAMKAFGEQEDTFKNLAGSLAAGGADAKQIESFLRKGIGEEALKAFPELQARLKTIAERAKKAAEAQQEYIKSLNLGLSGTQAGIAGLASSLGILNGVADGSVNAIQATAANIEAAFTLGAGGLSKRELEQTGQTLRESLLGAGASTEQAGKAEAKFLGISGILKQLDERNPGFEAIKQDLRDVAKASISGDAGTNPKELLKNLGDTLINRAGQNLPKETREAIKTGLANAELDDKTLAKLQQGDISVVEDILKNVNEETKKQILETINSFDKAVSEVVKSIKNLRAAQDALVDAQRRTVDLQVEANGILDSITKPGTLSPQQIKSRNEGLARERFNVGARVSGSRQLTTGSAVDIRASLGSMTSRQQRNLADQRRRNVREANVSGSGALTSEEEIAKARNNQDGRDQANTEELLDFTRKRIQEEQKLIDTIKQRNQAEKSALESLLAGDIEAFIKQQEAAGAAAALETGDRGLASLFGAQALGAGALELQKRGALTEDGARNALSAFGIDNVQAAQVLSDQTPEIQAAQREIESLAQLLPEFGRALEDIREMQVEAQTVIVNAANQKLDDIRRDNSGEGGAASALADAGKSLSDSAASLLPVVGSMQGATDALAQATKTLGDTTIKSTVSLSSETIKNINVATGETLAQQIAPAILNELKDAGLKPKSLRSDAPE